MILLLDLLVFFVLELVIQLQLLGELDDARIFLLIKESYFFVEDFDKCPRVDVAHYVTAVQAAPFVLLLVLVALNMSNVVIDVVQSQTLANLAAHGIINEDAFRVEGHDLLINTDLFDELEATLSNVFVFLGFALLVKSDLLKFTLDVSLMLFNELMLRLNGFDLATVVNETMTEPRRVLKVLRYVHNVFDRSIVLVKSDPRLVLSKLMVASG